MKGNKTSVREVQETLLSFISADTVLIGHCLEADLCALKVTTESFFIMNVSIRWHKRLHKMRGFQFSALSTFQLGHVTTESLHFCYFTYIILHNVFTY